MSSAEKNATEPPGPSAGRVTLEYDEAGERKRATWSVRRIEVNLSRAADGTYRGRLDLEGAVPEPAGDAGAPPASALSVPRQPVPPRAAGIGAVTVTVAAPEQPASSPLADMQAAAEGPQGDAR